MLRAVTLGSFLGGGEDTVSEHKPIEVAIIGGGCASITAAFELTRPEHKGKYHVTVYQLGWRLGGKAADDCDSSGIDPRSAVRNHRWTCRAADGEY